MNASLVAVARRSQPVTHWPERIGWTILTLAVLVGILLLMRRGWRGRGRRQAALPAPDAVPAVPGPLLAATEGVYVSTTSAGDWLDRIVVHRLGERSAARLSVHRDGVGIERARGSFWIGRDALTGVRREPGMAGKFVGGRGLVVLSWTLGPFAVDTGFHPEDLAAGEAVEDALTQLLSRETA